VCSSAKLVLASKLIIATLRDASVDERTIVPLSPDGRPEMRRHFDGKRELTELRVSIINE